MRCRTVMGLEREIACVRAGSGTAASGGSGTAASDCPATSADIDHLLRRMAHPEDLLRQARPTGLGVGSRLVLPAGMAYREIGPHLELATCECPDPATLVAADLALQADAREAAPDSGLGLFGIGNGLEPLRGAGPVASGRACHFNFWLREPLADEAWLTLASFAAVRPLLGGAGALSAAATGGLELSARASWLAASASRALTPRTLETLVHPAAESLGCGLRLHDVACDHTVSPVSTFLATGATALVALALARAGRRQSRPWSSCLLVDPVADFQRVSQHPEEDVRLDRLGGPRISAVALLAEFADRVGASGVADSTVPWASVVLDFWGEVLEDWRRVLGHCPPTGRAFPHLDFRAKRAAYDGALAERGLPRAALQPLLAAAMRVSRVLGSASQPGRGSPPSLSQRAGAAGESGNDGAFDSWSRARAFWRAAGSEDRRAVERDLDRAGFRPTELGSLLATAAEIATLELCYHRLDHGPTAGLFELPDNTESTLPSVGGGWSAVVQAIRTHGPPAGRGALRARWLWAAAGPCTVLHGWDFMIFEGTVGGDVVMLLPDPTDGSPRAEDTARRVRRHDYAQQTRQHAGADISPAGGSRRRLLVAPG